MILSKFLRAARAQMMREKDRLMESYLLVPNTIALQRYTAQNWSRRRSSSKLTVTEIAIALLRKKNDLFNTEEEEKYGKLQRQIVGGELLPRKQCETLV